MCTVPVFCPLLGVMLVTTGAVGAAVTVNPLASVPLCMSGFVTTTCHGPVAAPARLKSHVICDEFTTTTLVALMSAWPDLASLTVAPDWKLLPARLVMCTVPVFCPLLGVMLVTVGTGAAVAQPTSSRMPMPTGPGL